MSVLLAFPRRARLAPLRVPPERKVCQLFQSWILVDRMVEA